jgi:hypothetical protein
VNTTQFVKLVLGISLISFISFSVNPVFANEDAGMMEKIATKNLGRDIAFRFKPHMLGITGIEFERFRIAENEQYLQEHPYLSPWAVSAENVDIRYNPLGFLIGRINLTSIDIKRPQVQIAIDSQLRHNFEDIAEQQKKNRFSNWIRIHQITIDDMRFNIFSELIFAEPVKYHVDKIDVDISNVIKGKVANIDIKARTPGNSQQNVKISGTLGPIVSIARAEESPMDIKFRVTDAPLEFELAKIPESILKNKHYRRTLALPESGLANISYDLNGDIWDNLKVNGLISLTDIVFASIDKELKGKPFSVFVNSNTEVSLTRQTTTFNNVSININKAKIALKGNIQQVIDNPQANLSLYSENIDLAELNRIYPFFSEIYGIRVIQGTTELKLNATGNLKEGLALDGNFETKKIQLANYENSQQGKSLDSSVKLIKPIVYYAHKNEAAFEQIHINIANSLIRISGNTENVTNLDRNINARIQSTMMDVKAIHEFFPFFDKFLPSTLSYDGHFSFDSKASANAKTGSLKGNADFSHLNFVIENLARKKAKSRFDIEYKAGYEDYDNYYASGKVLLEKGELDNSVIYVNAMKHLLGGDAMSAEAKIYLAKIDPQKILFEKAEASMKYLGKNDVEVRITLNNIQNAVQKNVSMDMSGTFNVDTFTLNILGNIKLTKEVYSEIIRLNPKAKQYLNADQSLLILPMKLSGLFTDPKANIL